MSTQLSVIESRVLALVLETQLVSAQNYPVTARYLLEQHQKLPESKQFINGDVNTINDVLVALTEKGFLFIEGDTFSLASTQLSFVEQINHLKEDNAQIREKLELLQKQLNILFDASPHVSNKYVI